MPPAPAHQLRNADHNDCILIDYSKCIGCNACARTCANAQKFEGLSPSPVMKHPPYVVAKGGSTEGNSETARLLLSDSGCVGCGQCTNVCAFQALVPRPELEEVKAQLASHKEQGRHSIALIAPATRVGISEAMGMEPGTSAQRQLVAALHKLGFDLVYDVQSGADLTTLEDTKEVIHMREHKTGPCFTSCCPAWINLVETRYPELIPKLSTARSPLGMLASLVKGKFAESKGWKPAEIYSVACMPCTAKKSEARRPQLSHEGVPDVDNSLTTKELAQWFKAEGIKFSAEEEARLVETNEEAGRFDPPFDEFSGGAFIFGKAAGVATTVVRCIAALKNVPQDQVKIETESLWESGDKSQGITKMSFEIAGEKYTAAAAHGGEAANKVAQMVLAKELDVDAVEVMACPGGCMNGGGQPRQIKKPLVAKRAERLEQLDKESSYGDCMGSKALMELYHKLLPTEEDIHREMHTHYESRK